MEIILRCAAIFLNLIGIITLPIFNLYAKFTKCRRPPKIENKVLTMSATELAAKIRTQELKSIDVIDAYIARLRDVRDVVNGVILDRYTEARREAKRADEICLTTPVEEIVKKYPLLGVPFTVKESCAVKGMLLEVGNRARLGIKALQHGDAVQRLVDAGAIPLLISMNPEYCLSWETRNLLHGVCKNPYDVRRTPGGSSGGEGALNGCAASVFGIGSDIAGSIRVPSMFNGLFGHKPTGRLVSVEGHFPNSTDPDFPEFLQLGPITRFAKDLPLLTYILAGENGHKLGLDRLIHTKDIKIYYTDLGFSFTHTPITTDIINSMRNAIQHFKQNGVVTKQIDTDFSKIMEITLSTSLAMTDVPDLMAHIDNPKKRDNAFVELLKSIILPPKYSRLSLFFTLIQDLKAFMTAESRAKFVEKGKLLREELKEILGDDGVLFFPTFHCPAFLHATSVYNLGGVPFCTIFNILGFPATHVPMGLGKDGLPVGFQVVAAPFQDKLCFQIAGELEAAFGGWVPPLMVEPVKDDD